MTRRTFFRTLTLLALCAATSLARAAAPEIVAPEIVAHRGASHGAPENTIAAIRLAWEQKADAVEFDVYLTKDGQIVVIHDADTKRTAGVARKVVDQSFAELRKLDVGSWKHARFAGEKIPSLAEVLSEIPAGKRAFIEVKCGPEIVPELKRVAQASKLGSEQMAVISFNAEVVAAAKAALPQLKAYWIVDPKPDKKPAWTTKSLLAKSQEIKADGLDLSVQPIVTGEFVRGMKRENLPVFVWTVDDAAVAKRMVAAGVLGITTNRPAWLREQLQQK
ncbi:MAG: glycerophosphodiester phosphodiesterase [Pirellulales bacterium]